MNVLPHSFPIWGHQAEPSTLSHDLQADNLLPSRHTAGKRHRTVSETGDSRFLRAPQVLCHSCYWCRLVLYIHRLGPPPCFPC